MKVCVGDCEIPASAEAEIDGVKYGGLAAVSRSDEAVNAG